MSFFHQQIRHPRRPTDSCKDCKHKPSPNLQSLQESLSFWLQVWILWKQLRHLKSSQQEKLLVRCTVSTKSARRELRVSGRSCSYSEIHLWLQKLWSVIASSQSTFYITGAGKDNKNRWNTLLFCQKRWNCYLASKCLLMLQFNQPNIVRKKCSISMLTIHMKLLEMCIVQHVETKSVFTFQSIKLLVSTIVKCTKPQLSCAEYSMQGTKANKTLFGGDGTYSIAKRRIGTTKNHLFGEFSPPITSYSKWTRTEKRQNHSLYGINMLSSKWLREWPRLSTFDSFQTTLIKIQAA